MSADLSTTRLDLGTGGEPADVLLKARGVKKYFPVRKGMLKRTVGQLQAVDGVDLDVFRGETVGLVGESGCGKSTLGRTLLRLLEPTAGEIEFDGVDVLRLGGSDLKAMRRHMQIVFQDSVGSLDPRMNVSDLVGEGLRDPRARAQAPRRGRDRGARARRPQRRGGRALPAPVQRRPAPADRPRARPRAAPEVHRRGRAGVRARRLDPVAGAQPPRRAEARVQPDLPLRRPRPRRRRLHLRPRRGHVPRQDRRAGDLRGALPPAAAPVHDGPALGEPGADPGAQAPAGRAPRRRAEPDQPALRLPLPDPLPDRAGHLRRGGAAARGPRRTATAPRATSPGQPLPGRRPR